jgi:hypothetical protein
MRRFWSGVTAELIAGIIAHFSIDVPADEWIVSAVQCPMRFKNRSGHRKYITANEVISSVNRITSAVHPPDLDAGHDVSRRNELNRR